MTVLTAAADASPSKEDRKTADYQREVAKALTKAFDKEEHEEELDLDSARIIVFSDHHKGSRDNADDFRGCERAYAAALAYYFEEGFRLLALGDVEELWECSAKEVLKAYPEVLALEGEFHAAGRYVRFWGNHDLQWSSESEVARYLRKLKYFSDLEVRETLKLRVVRGGQRLGLLFFAHGHQGTLDSDKWAFLSRPVVHHVWRPLQRYLNMRSTQPSRQFELRARHDAAMFSWARQHPAKPVLIAGHTHRPVFWGSKPPARESEEELAVQLKQLRDSGAKPDDIAKLHARLEFVRATERERGDPPIPIDPPCYFNTGCCSFGDGDVTGIEIADGEIRLVRWPDDDDNPAPKVLVGKPLAEVLDRVSPGAVAATSPR